MKKYIVELSELPNNCFVCPLVSYGDDITNNAWCGITGEGVGEYCRGERCPIKSVEETV